MALPNFSKLSLHKCQDVGIILTEDGPVQPNDDNCAICFEPLVVADQPQNDDDDPLDYAVEALECNQPNLQKYRHQFHFNCILQWAEQLLPYEITCPICRTPVTQEEGDIFVGALEAAEEDAWDDDNWIDDGLGNPIPFQNPATPAARAARAAPARPAARAARAAQNRRPRRKSFLYIVVRNLGFGQATRRSGPHIMLLGHTQRSGKRQWGTPGGLRDRTDTSEIYNAVREFVEEMGLKEPTRGQVDPAAALRRQVNATIALLRTNGNLRTVVPTNNAGFSGHVVVFDTALQFEQVMGLSKLLRNKGITNPGQAPTIQQKYDVRLSSETKGYTYVPLTRNGLITRPVSNNQGEQYLAVRSASDLGSRQLRIRRGMSNRVMKAGFAMV